MRSGGLAAFLLLFPVPAGLPWWIPICNWIISVLCLRDPDRLSVPGPSGHSQHFHITPPIPMSSGNFPLNLRLRSDARIPYPPYLSTERPVSSRSSFTYKGFGFGRAALARRGRRFPRGGPGWGRSSRRPAAVPCGIAALGQGRGEYGMVAVGPPGRNRLVAPGRNRLVAAHRAAPARLGCGSVATAWSRLAGTAWSQPCGLLPRGSDAARMRLGWRRIQRISFWRRRICWTSSSLASVIWLVS